MDCFELEHFAEGFGVEPWWGHDVGAALAFEQDGEPEGEVGALGWDEGFGWALGELSISTVAWFLLGVWRPRTLPQVL